MHDQVYVDARSTYPNGRTAGGLDHKRLRRGMARWVITWTGRLRRCANAYLNARSPGGLGRQRLREERVA
jgi:hypothetical protein